MMEVLFEGSATSFSELKSLKLIPTEKTPGRSTPSNGHHEARDVKNAWLAAFGLLLQAYTHSWDISFLHGEHWSSSQATWILKSYSFSIDKELSIANFLKRVAASHSPVSQDIHQVPYMLLCLEELGHIPAGVGLKAGLVLSISIEQVEELCVHYDPAVVSSQSAQRFAFQLVQTRQQLRSQQWQLHEVAIFSDEDAVQLRQWNGIPQQRVYRTIHDRVSDWLMQHPHEVTVCAWDGEMTRTQLDQASERLARFLTSRGCGRGQNVAILVPKSVWLPLAVLAVLKTGAAFILLDQELPLERLKVMTSVVPCYFALASKENVSLATKLVENVAVLDAGEALMVNSTKRPSSHSKPSPSSPEDLALFNFTSGSSSGRPKAVATQHFAWCSGYTREAFSLATPGTRCLHRSSNNFIVSCVELLVPLMSGGTVCIPSTEELTVGLSRAIRRLRPTWISIPPSLAKTLDHLDLPSLETVIFVGEMCPISLQKAWLDSPVKDVRNGYGSTEACSFTSERLIPHFDPNSRNIGRSVSRRYWIVDPSDHDRLAPIGAVGELVMEGYSLAQGYYQEPGKTAQGFIDSPAWASTFGAGLHGRRWYKTGDLVRYTNSGELLLLGRKDFQVKLHGQRIEPAEVESQIDNNFSGEVQDVIVDIIMMAGDAAKPRLTAFIILRSATHSHDYTQELQGRITTSLSQRLPSYMVPGIIIILPAFPQTASGKIDRRALQSLEQESPQSRNDGRSNGHEPVIHDENFLLLRHAWADVLNVKEHDLTPHSSWAELGGDSANGILLAQKANKKGFTMTLADVLRSHDLNDLLQKTKPLERRSGLINGHSSKRLDQSQDGAWHSTSSFQRYCYDVGSGAHKSLIYQYLVIFRGVVVVDLLKDAVASLFERYDALRLTFTSNGTRQMAYSASDDEVKQRLRVVRCANADEEMEKQTSKLQTTMGEGEHEPILFIILASSTQVRMVVRLHHTIMDGTSMALIFRSLQNAYGFSNSPKPEPQFLPYLEQRLLVQKPESLEYWRNLLEGSKPTMLRRSARDLADNNAHLTDMFATRIVALPSTLPGGATVSTLIKSAWAIVLAAMVNIDDVVYYYLLNGRDESIPESLEVVGCCVTEVPMRVHLSPASTGAQLLEQVQSQVLASIAHTQLGADTIARECAKHWEGEIVYRHSSFLHHQNVEHVQHFILGDEAYADITEDVLSDTVLDFAIISSALGKGAVECVVEASQHVYSREELDLVADGLVRTMQTLSARSQASLAEVMAELNLDIKL